MLVQFGHWEFGVAIEVPVYDQHSVRTLRHLLSADQSMKFHECGVLVCMQWNANSGEMRCFPHDTTPGSPLDKDPHPFSSARAPCPDPRNEQRSPGAQWHGLVFQRIARSLQNIIHCISRCRAGRRLVAVAHRVCSPETVR